MVSTSCLG
ncbi:hypothetical protein YPPY19_4640, partial [Yersinia pestis PY-19]